MAKTHTPQEEHQGILVKRFGKTVLKYGFTGVPNAFLMYERKLQINSTQSRIITHLWATWWGKYPCPTISTIGQRLNKGDRCIQTNIRKIASEIEQVIDEEGVVIKAARPALIEIRTRFNEKGEQISNEYDFTPMLLYLEQLILEDEEGTRVNLSAGRRVNLSAGRGVNLSAGRGVNLSAPFEESSNNNFDKDRSFESSKENSQNEGVFGNHESQSFELSTPSSPPTETTKNGHRNGNDSYNDSNTETTTNHNRNQSKPDSEEAPRPQKRAVLPKKDRQYLPAEVGMNIETITVTFNDREHMSSNLTRAANIYAPARAMGLAETDYLDIINWARSKANLATKINTRNKQGQINRMPYFFTTLANAIARVIETWREEDRQAARASTHG